jgi:hypothetical protein
VNAHTSKGLFAAAPHPSHPDLLVIACRDHRHAEALAAWYGDWRTELARWAIQGDPTASLGPLPRIVRKRDRWSWRIVMPRSAWAAFRAESAEDMDGTLAGQLQRLHEAWEDLKAATWAERGTLGAAILLSIPAVLILLSYFRVI